MDLFYSDLKRMAALAVTRCICARLKYVLVVAERVLINLEKPVSENTETPATLHFSTRLALGVTCIIYLLFTVVIILVW